jgi:hypothetical protein
VRTAVIARSVIKMLWSIVLSFGIASGALADSLSLFNVDPGSPVSAYEAGVSGAVWFLDFAHR